VMYGATSFVGVVQVVRRAPSDVRPHLDLVGGSYESGGATLGTPLPRLGRLESALTADFHRTGFRDERSSVERGHALWRGRASTARGVFRVDLDATWLRQRPGSPAPREGQVLSPRVPVDANHNPDDAALDENRYFGTAAYERALSFGSWSTEASFAHSGQDQLRGFLRALSEGPSNAAGFEAELDQTDVYFDSHLAWSVGRHWRAVAGVDLLHGKATAEGQTFDYGVGLDGRELSGRTAGEERRLEDRRDFLGAYANLEWTPSAEWRVDLGVRLNRTEEERGEGEADEEPGAEEEKKREILRASGGAGITWMAWRHEDDMVRLYANWKIAFKPAAIDFNLAEDPAAEGEAGILEPETSNSFEAGARTELLHHALRLEVSTFLMDLENLVVAQSIGGLPALTNAGQVRLKGVELSALWQPVPHLFARGSYSCHDARFRDYLTQFDGVPTQVAGNRLEMSPHGLAALGLSWAPEGGVFASAELSYVGSRFLNKRNSALAQEYATVAARVGYRSGRWEVHASGRDLTDRRDPVAESELGDAQYYRLFPRRIEAGASVRF